MPIRFLLSQALLLLLTPVLLAQSETPSTALVPEAQERPALAGEISEGRYISPTGLFSIEIPVIEALGGTISDTDSVVTFEDLYLTHVTIAAFPMDEAMQAELKTSGRKEFLVQFFAKKVLPALRENLPGSRVESGVYLAGIHEGAVRLMTLMPGGSRFQHRISKFSSDPGETRLAKRGNLLLIHGNHILLISTELAERSTEGSQHTMTVAEEDALLHKRLLKIHDAMHFKS